MCTRRPADVVISRPTSSLRCESSGVRQASAQDGYRRRVYLFVGAGRFRICDAHAAVDAAAFDHGECASVDVSDDHGGTLYLDAIGRIDGALHASADDGFTRIDVTAHFALSAVEHLSCCANAAFDAAFDLYDAIGVDVAEDLGSGGDDGECVAVGGKILDVVAALRILIEDRHE